MQVNYSLLIFRPDHNTAVSKHFWWFSARTLSWWFTAMWLRNC